MYDTDNNDVDLELQREVLMLLATRSKKPWRIARLHLLGHAVDRQLCIAESVAVALAHPELRWSAAERDLLNAAQSGHSTQDHAPVRTLPGRRASSR